MIKDKNQSWGSFILETIILIAIVLFIRFYVFQFFRVSGPSMCPTLNILDNECQSGKGEFIFVNELLYNFLKDPQRGDVVVFHPPQMDVYYIKRIIGIPGDTIQIKKGKVYLTNKEVQDYELPETYLSEKNRGFTQSYNQDTFVVPDGYYLLFGDNRSKSFDARHCFNTTGCDGSHTPFVPKKNIQGKADFVIWPLSTMRWIHNELKEQMTGSGISITQ